MYTTDTLPAHLIVPGDNGTLYLVPTIPGGWAKRRPYRGHVTALQAMDATATQLMRTHLGCPDEPPRLYSTNEVAGILGVDRSRVSRMAHARGLGQRIGQRTLVFSASDIDAMRSRVPGRPRNP